MSDAQRLRDKAHHARELAVLLSDPHSIGALEAYADELERQADELDGIDPGNLSGGN